MHRRRSAAVLAAAVAVPSALTVVGAPGADAAPATRVTKLSDKVSVDGHPVAGGTAKLLLSSSVPSGDKLTKYELSYGDVSQPKKGSTLPKTTTHVYGRVGTYHITLTVTDKHKKTAKATFTVIVSAPPAASGGATAGASPSPAPSTSPPSTAPTVPVLQVTSADSAPLNLPTPRLIFSAAQGGPPAPDRSFTFTNVGTGTLTVSGLTVSGPDAGDFMLAPGQPTTLTLAAQQSVPVVVEFRPSAPTNCPTSSSAATVSNDDRAATLTYTTDDAGTPTGSDDLAGIVACGYEGNNEPVLDQIVTALGYTTHVVPAGATDAQRRNLTPARDIAGTDEISSPYFTAADPTLPVTVTPVAHYSGISTDSAGSMHTGWYLQGSGPVVGTGRCTASCNALWDFPPDTTSGYTENQKLMPVPTGPTTFTPSGVFGLYDGEYNAVNFTDDGLNSAETAAGAAITPPHYLHDIRVFPAYGPGHVQIPGTYILAVDITKIPNDKNDDYQDVVDVVTNVTPAAPTGPATVSHDLTAPGGTVSANCAVTGFDGVFPNAAGTQCQPGQLSFGPSGLTVTSDAGQLANGDQSNALYDTFDASRGQFTVTARVVGPIDYLTQGYSQVGTWFGPDSNDFIKVEAEHSATGTGGTTDPHLVMFYDEKGTAGTVASVSVPSLSAAKTLDLIIVGNSNVPDPITYGTSTDPNGVHGYPLDELTAYYSIDGAAPVRIGSTYESPADVEGWFATDAKAGILVSNTGNTTPVAPTFSSFTVTEP